MKEGLFGRAYEGSNKYVLTFPKGQLPPVRGFWSITMYNDQYFFVENPLNRYSISARQDLKTNPDGSTDISRTSLRGPTRNRTGCRRRRTGSC